MEEELQNKDIQYEIQRYLRESMSDAERQEFLSKMKANSKLYEEVQFSKDLLFTLQHKDALAVQHILKTAASSTPIQPDTAAAEAMEKELGLRTSGSWGSTALLLGSLIVAVLLIGVVWSVTLNGLFESSTSKLAQPYVVPFEIVISTNEATEQTLQTGIQAYRQADYSVAIKQLSSYLQIQPDENIKLYLAISQLLNDEADAAIKQLQILEGSTIVPVKYVAEWYAALAFLKIDEPEEARTRLQNIINTADHPFVADADSLLQQLNEIQPPI